MHSSRYRPTKASAKGTAKVSGVVTLGERLADKVDRSGEHHIWTGAKDGRGVGLISVHGRITTVRRAMWELANGALAPGDRVLGCPADPACLRLEHLSLKPGAPVTPPSRGRARKGMGSMRELRPDTWELRVTAGRWADGRVRTRCRTVTAGGEADAAAQLVAFLNEMAAAQHPSDRQTLDMTVDQALDRFLSDYLGAEKGRADKTIDDYRRLHQRWFAPTIGDRRVARVDARTMDGLFGAMRNAGLSASRLNQAKSLCRPFFRWAKRRGMTTRDPMADFEMPTSSYVSKERTPPEVEQLTLLLATAVETVPEVAPLLMLGAVTGMRRGELVGIRRSRVLWDSQRIVVDAAISESRRVKSTKTRRQRSFHVDAETMAMLGRVCQEMDERAAQAGVEVCADPFLFSLKVDGSEPMPPDYLTRRDAVLKGHLGIEDKRPETIALEDEALRLHRQPPPPRAAGKTGPAPRGGMSLREIGERLGRSERWAAAAIDAATRREKARASGLGKIDFDGSVLALRKFTRASSSTPASTSAWSPTDRATEPKSSPATTPNRGSRLIAKRPSISVVSSICNDR